MKPGAGKRKGSTFEREFCKELSLWWTDGKDKDVFWRTHSSGARHGISEECGDVMAVKPEGNPLTDKIMFELKHWNRPDLLLDMIRTDKKSELKDAWTKCIFEAEKNKKAPVLVLKVTNKTTVVLFKSWDGLLIEKHLGPHFVFDKDYPGYETYIVQWKKFLECCKFKEWRL